MIVIFKIILNRFNQVYRVGTMKVKELLFVITLKDIRMKSSEKTNERLVIIILRRMTLLIIVALEEVMREGLRDEEVEVLMILIILLKILLLSPMIISKPLSTFDLIEVA